MTEIYDYLRLLFARVGRRTARTAAARSPRQTVEQIVDQLYELPEGTRLMLLAPLVRDRKGEHEKLLTRRASRRLRARAGRRRAARP